MGTYEKIFSIFEIDIFTILSLLKIKVYHMFYECVFSC